MPAATTKDALHAVCEKEFGKLSTLMDKVAPDDAVTKDGDDTSIKDVIAHRAHWIDLFLGWYADGLAGKHVDFPAPGYNWGDLKAYNADLRARQSGVGWDEARGMLDASHQRLTQFLAEKTEAELYGGPMKGGRNTWTTGRWAEAAGPSHYRSAAKYIRSTLRAAH